MSEYMSIVMSGCHLSIAIVLLKKKIWRVLCVFRRGCECKCWPQYKDSCQIGTELPHPTPHQAASPVLLTELPERPEMREIAQPDLP